MEQTVGVFFGGRSNEREISVITGMLAVNLLWESGRRVLPVYLPPEGGMATAKNLRRVEDIARGRRLLPVRMERGGVAVGRRHIALGCALNCCHGGMGEDGTLAALFDWYAIPSASPSLPLSAVFMDKELTKIAARGLGVPAARSFCVRERRWAEAREEVLAEAARFGYPVIVKPVRLGSSIGVKVARGEEELVLALALAFSLDGAALVEEYFPDRRDINCAAYARGGEIVLSPLEEVFSDGDLLSFREKYEAPAKRSELPARLPEAVAEGIRESTRRIAEAFSLRGVVRADFLVTGEKYYFNELNAVPGSLAGYLFSDSMIGCRDFLSGLLGEAKLPAEKKLVQSGILSSPVFAGGKGKRR